MRPKIFPTLILLALFVTSCIQLAVHAEKPTAKLFSARLVTPTLRPISGLTATQTPAPQTPTAAEEQRSASSTSRPTTTATHTPLHQPTASPTPSPRPAPDFPLSLAVNSCMTIPIDENNQVVECVTGITVYADGRMQFDFSWTAEIEAALEVEKRSDRDNRNLYLTDNRFQRYDHIDRGGAAAETVILLNGDTAEGWFLFPPVDPTATFFIFHDDDNLTQTLPIPRSWP